MSSGIQLLVVEDDENLRLTLRDFLEDEYTVVMAGDLANARRQLSNRSFDLIVLDLMLPDGDGYTFCEQLRAGGVSVPILMLTARSLEDDLVKGFAAGADDYLVKPYRSAELLARVRALLKRPTTAAHPLSVDDEFLVNDFTVNRSARSVRGREGHNIDLTPKELDLLLYLWDNPHKAISRMTLLERVWGNTVIDTRTVDNFISSIKKKLHLSTGSPTYVETVRGVGYRLEKNL